jgi:succinoglycan biosynthesis transport protein ExoP
LLVDADMRRPSLHQVLGTPLTPGLSDVLGGDANLDQVIRDTPVPGLCFIPAGYWHERLPRLLAGNAWPDLKTQLEAEFDYVVVDSSPILPVADTLLLARHVDGVLLSLLHDVSRLGPISQAKERLDRVGTNVLGVVINGLTGDNYGSPYRHTRNSLESLASSV